MNKLFLINGQYYVLAFDYYDAITIFQEYKKEYSESIIDSIESVSENVVCKGLINLDDMSVDEDSDEV